MNKVDFSDINRFLVSVGLIFYGLAVGIPWLFQKDAQGLLVSQQQLDSLSESSRNLLNQKEAYVQIIQDVIPWLSLSLFIFGTIAIAIGIFRWHTKQAILDESETPVRYVQ